MSRLANEHVIAPRVRLLQIVIGALLAGIATFAAIVLVIGPRNVVAPPNQPLVSWIAAAYVPMALTISAIVVRSVINGARKRLWRDDAAIPAWLSIYYTVTIIGAAFLEGAAFFLLVTYLIEGTTWTLPVVVALWLLMAWLYFPTMGGVERWLSEQQDAAGRHRLES